ncbi:TPA: hypothetical protein DDW35_12420, partial [Candidatus Sumerlaeota bacterium]|jgi:hypothetical protein|nr:hypothetical protein [Candidatus Sumerlaeota bacterium]
LDFEEFLHRRVEFGEMLLKDAAWQMGVSLQVVRIKQFFLKDSAEGLVHQTRGMPSHRKKTAAEKMRECEKITVGRETLRQWLMPKGCGFVAQKNESIAASENVARCLARCSRSTAATGAENPAGMGAPQPRAPGIYRMRFKDRSSGFANEVTFLMGVDT